MGSPRISVVRKMHCRCISINDVWNCSGVKETDLSLVNGVELRYEHYQLAETSNSQREETQIRGCEKWGRP